MTRQRLPTAVRWLIRLTVPDDTSPQVVWDLEELWERERANAGDFRAAIWLWREVLSFAVRFTVAGFVDLVSRIACNLPGHLEAKLVRRTVARTPLVTATAVLALAIGITIAASAFGVVSALMFASLDVPDGDRVIQLRDVDRRTGWDQLVDGETYVTRRQAMRSLDGLAAFSTADVLLDHPSGGGKVVNAALVSFNAFEVLRVTPVSGRFFSPADEATGDLDLCVVGAELATELFGSPADAVGATLRTGGRLLTVVGVAHEGFRFPYASTIWVPEAFDGSSAGPASWRLFGRLAAGATPATVSTEYALVAGRDSVPGNAPEQMEHRVLGFTDLAGKPSVLWGLWLFVAGLTGLLLVSAANVANLLLARAATRDFEFAVRSALGASRERIVGQLVLEAMVVAAAAAFLGGWGARQLLAWFGAAVTDLPYWVDLSLDWRFVAFITALALLSTVIVSILPARRVLRESAAQTLKDGQAPVGFGRLSGVLIAAELAVAIGFLGGTASIGPGLARFGFGDSQIPAERVLVAQLYFGQPPALERPDAPMDPVRRQEERARFHVDAIRQAERLAELLRQSPLVTTAALGSHFPGNEPSPATVEIEGDETAAVHRTNVVEIGPDYGEVLTTGVVRGRMLISDDYSSASGGVLVNETFARRYRLGPALGRRLRLRSSDDASGGTQQPWREVVGVLPDLALNPGNANEGDGIYLPLRPTNIVRIAVRARESATPLIPLLHREVLSLDPRPRVQWAKSLSAQMAEPVTVFRALGIGLTVLGIIALVLSAAGLYALLALQVSQSRRELAVRKAIGAGGWRIAGAVLARTVRPALIGTVAGTLIGVVIAQAVSTVPFAVERNAASGLAGTLGALAVIAVLGCLIPLRRALRVRPIELLR